jgi:hypothetical protein
MVLVRGGGAGLGDAASLRTHYGENCNRPKLMLTPANLDFAVGIQSVAEAGEAMASNGGK